MNEYLLSVLLGVVEGLTEFLPVSSTAHIRLTQALCGVDLHSGFWKMFAVVIQLPAIMAVVIYFRRRIVEFVKSFFSGPMTPGRLLTHPLSLVLMATVVTAIPAKLLKHVIKDNLGSLYVIGGALVVGGIVMWVVDVLAKHPTTETVDQMKPWQAIWIGAVQILSAVFPGTSRSMSTIAAGQVAGLSRVAALEFSFFLSIPIMFAACIFDLKDSLQAPIGNPDYVGVMTSQKWAMIGLGSAVSFLVALVVIAWFMSWVRKHGFVPFAIYRIVLGVIVLGVAAGVIGSKPLEQPSAVPVVANP